MKKTIKTLDAGDILHRNYPIQEDCEIKHIENDNGRRLFYFSGFVAPDDAIKFMFKHFRGQYNVKNNNEVAK